MDAYLAAAQIADDRKGPLFRSLDRERYWQIANHPLKRTFGESPRTTKPYGLTSDAIRAEASALMASAWMREPAPLFRALSGF